MFEMKPYEIWLARLPKGCERHLSVRRPVVLVSEPTAEGWVSVVPCTSNPAFAKKRILHLSTKTLGKQNIKVVTGVPVMVQQK